MIRALTRTVSRNSTTQRDVTKSRPDSFRQMVEFRP